MNPQDVNNTQRLRMREFEQLHPTLAMVEYDCLNTHLCWTAACSSRLQIPVSLQVLPLRRWLSLFDRVTRKMMWQICAAMLTQRRATHVLVLPAMTLADGRSLAVTTQIDICYASDQQPIRITAVVLHQINGHLTGTQYEPGGVTVDAPAPTARESRSHALRGPLGAIAAATEVLQSGIGNERVRERALQIIDRQVRQLARLVDALGDPD